MSVNKRLIEYIRVKGVSQSEIAKKLNIAQPNLNRILNSDDLKVSQLIELCTVLEVSPTYFFDGTETINNEELERLKQENALLKQNTSLINQNLNLGSKLFLKTQLEVLDEDFKDVSEDIKNKLISEVKGVSDGMSNLNNILEEFFNTDKEKIKAHFTERIREITLIPRAINISKIKEKRKKDTLENTSNNSISNEELLKKLDERTKTARKTNKK